ncbi:MAG: alpha/beta hydrolase-fold protein [Saprospiraceae bacterium]|nr:alpha/beta hydrolase-fold protein [Saprospiraceae bacterium]
MKTFFSTLFLLFTLALGYTQNQTFKFSAEVSFDQKIMDQVQETGRLYVFLSQNHNAEPYTQTWPSPAQKTFIFAKNIDPINTKEAFTVGNDAEWVSTADWSLEEVPSGEYTIQVLWDQDFSESRINAPGNIYSTKQKVNIDKDSQLDLQLSQIIAPRMVIEHELAKVVELKSDLLSEWWDKPMYLKAAVLLPHNYDASKAYPILYNVAGYGGRYTRINNMLGNTYAMNWWQSGTALEIITVFLDGEGPFGDSYQMDSDNSGPYGRALVEELIPHIESTYRGTDSPTTRFVDGCSTGGWVSLGLQLYYPDVFNGAFSYSPDAIDFEAYQLVNIYKDQNVYTNEFGYPRPVMRDVNGEPMLSLKEFIQYENVLGYSNTYLNSGGQFSAHSALYSPKGENGLPKPLFDPQSGDIDREVAEHWKKYDFTLYAKENWAELGPKVQDKIYIWMGDMDHFYLNPATRKFAKFIEETESPKSNALIEFSAMEGHCSQYSPPIVLDKVGQRIQEIEGQKEKK